MDELVKKLIVYKQERSLTNKQLAERLDVPEVYIYRWLHNKVKISNAYRRIITELIK